MNLPLTTLSNLRIAIEYLDPRILKEKRKKICRHSKHQIDKIAASLGAFGFVCPVLIDEHNRIVAGDARVKAAIKLGMSEIPCVRIEHLSKEEIRLLSIALNSHSDNSSFDEKILADELRELDNVIEINAEALGFDTARFNLIIEGGFDPDFQEPNDIILLSNIAARCRKDDQWRLGNHLLYCGDPSDPFVHDQLNDDGLAQAAFCDLTKLKINGNDNSSRSHGLKPGTTARTCRDGDDYFLSVLKNYHRSCCEGAVIFVFSGWERIFDLSRVAQEVEFEIVDFVVVKTDQSDKGNFYRAQHEIVLVFRKRHKVKGGQAVLVRPDRHRSNLWSASKAFQRNRKAASRVAITSLTQPVKLLGDAIADVTARDAIVLDLSESAGSTLLAAQSTGRRARIAEANPNSCDIILARYEAFSRRQASQVACGWPKDK